MESIKFSQELPPREPSPEEISEYFYKLALRFRNDFKILKEFDVFGKKAKKEGWFMGYHSVVEVAVALKIADFVHLSAEDRRVLTEAAVLDAFYKRKEIETKPQDSMGVDAVHRKGAEALRMRGVNEDVVEIIEGTSALFPMRIATEKFASRRESSERIYHLQKILAYVHNLTQTTITKDENGKKIQSTDVIHWKERLEDAKIRYPQIMLEKKSIDGKEYTNFDLEDAAMRAIEHEIAESLQISHPEINVEEVEKDLPAYIRRKIFDDIVAKNDLST